MATTASGLDAFDHWQIRYSIPTDKTLYGVAYGNGRFIAVGEMGTMITSTNGTDWSLIPSAETNRLNVVMFHGGRFFVGGESGVIMLSEHGTDWTYASMPTRDHVTALCFGQSANKTNGLYVGAAVWPASGQLSIMLSSSNGLDWSTNWVHPNNGKGYGGDYFRSIAFGNDTFLASGGDPVAPADDAYYTTSGTFWTGLNILGFVQVNEPVAFGNGLFVTVDWLRHPSNSIAVFSRTSANGIDWVPRTGIGGVPLALAYVGEQFVAFGSAGNLAASSSDGTNWTVRQIASDARIRAVTYGGGLYVAVGELGVILLSQDASEWTFGSSIGRSLNAIAASEEGFLAVGSSGYSVASHDGITWEPIGQPTTNALAGVAKGTSHYVAVGDAGTILAGLSAANMSARASGTTNRLNGVTFANGLYVVVGNQGTLRTSTDTMAWVPSESGTTNHLYRIAHGNGAFVIVGDKGTLLTSQNGSDWISKPMGTNLPIVDVVWGNGRFVATCNARGPIFTSIDGLAWEANQGVPTSAVRISYGNGFFMITGERPWQGGIHTSTDGKQWSIHRPFGDWPLTRGYSPRPPFLRDLAYGKGCFVGVGFAGQIVQSDPIIRLEISRTESSRISVHGPANRSYRIESLDSFDGSSSWQDRATLTQSPYLWIDEPSTVSNRLYRAVLVP